LNKPPECLDADVIAAFGRHLLVRDAAGATHAARPFGRHLGVVCGDRVACERDGHGEVIAVRVLPRRSVLERSNLRGGNEVIVANLTQLVVVLAAVPRPDLFMVDRYLAAAASLRLRAVVVVNKCDLALDPELEPQLAVFASLGYPVHRVGARGGEGLEALSAALANETSVLLGQSGVGKSSLIRRLTVDGAEAATGDLMREAEGRHTTTSSRCYTGLTGGVLIDSPGVRDYAPSIDALEQRSLGFVEVDRAGAGCQFMDCRHMNEPGCAVKSALESSLLDARRYESYRRLRRLAEQLQAARGPAGQHPPRGGRSQRRV
jgi:ribosome biogenesis GTPase